MRIILLSLISVIIIKFFNNNGMAADPGSFFTEGSRDTKKIALTFDDGPGLETDKILQILEEQNVKATFFVVGSKIELYPQKVKNLYERGHEIGNHTYSHYNFYKLKKDRDKEELLADEIEKTNKLINEITGFNPRILRMPNGYVRSWVKKVAKEKNYILVNWTFGCDWKKNEKNELVDLYTKNIRPGAIFLMHDCGWNTKNLIKALPEIITEIKKRGYEIVTISELLNCKNKEIKED